MKTKWAKNKKGFTIVELLIVIVVIGILAAIVVVAYNGVLGRAQDSRRLNDMREITKALERYKIDHGRYPVVSTSGLGVQAGWESSAREAEGEFIAALKDYGFNDGTPVDPINNSTEDSTYVVRANNSFGYVYYRYEAGNGGCDPQNGPFYVLGVTTTATAGGATHSSSPGFACTRNWGTDFSWVTGGFEN